jgi:hypothetical protein
MEGNGMKTEDITITITKDDYGTDESYNLFLWCKRHKIKIEEPRNSEGLFNKMIIHLDTLEKQVLFQQKYIDKLKQYAEIINQSKKSTHKSSYDLNRGGFKNIKL